MLPVPAPFAMVTVPEVGVRFVDTALTDTTVPAPLLISGLAEGNEVSFAIGTNPPVSSSRSTILASIAAEVATFASVPDHVSPLEIVSEESCLRNKPSASVSV